MVEKVRRNPNGIESFSPALRGKSYAGKTAANVINSEGIESKARGFDSTPSE
jgi:hypothetical protein